MTRRTGTEPRWALRRVKPALPLVIAAAALTACGDASGGAADRFAVRDSAGIQIAESSGPLWEPGEGWTLSAEPVVSIGRMDGASEYLLDAVNAAWRLGPDRFVVSTRTDYRYFDASGEHLQTVGKAGEGPGEFRLVSNLWPGAGDTIHAYDLQNARLSTFSPEGEFVRSVTLQRSTQIDGALDDGTLVVPMGVSLGGNTIPNGLFRSATDYVHLSADGVVLDTISRQPGSERFIRSESAGGQITSIMIMSLPFARNQVAITAGDRVVLGGNDSYQLDVYTPEGRLERVIRRLVAPRPVTDQDVANALEDRLANAADADARRRVEQSFRDVPIPATMPFYERALADEEGNLWVKDFVPPGGGVGGWSVFDAEGRLLGTVMLPDRFTPRHIGADFVLGVGRDELDVQHVEMYALDRG